MFLSVTDIWWLKLLLESQKDRLILTTETCTSRKVEAQEGAEEEDEDEQDEEEEEEKEEAKSKSKKRPLARSPAAAVGRRSTKKLNNAPGVVVHLPRLCLFAEQFHCSECTAIFTSKLKYTIHLQLHKNGLLCHVCERCGRQVKRGSELKKHMKKHTGEKPFMCSFCDYKSNRRASLQRHMRTHTGEKPYKCSLCDYKCNESGNLKSHMRTHTGEKPLKCSLCDYKSDRRAILKRHIKTHTREKPLKCSCAITSEMEATVSRGT
eukprot:g16236.t1